MRFGLVRIENGTWKEEDISYCHCVFFLMIYWSGFVFVQCNPLHCFLCQGLLRIEIISNCVYHFTKKNGIDNKHGSVEITRVT